MCEDFVFNLELEQYKELRQTRKKTVFIIKWLQKEHEKLHSYHMQIHV